jgi:hypothetical protein
MKLSGSTKKSLEKIILNYSWALPKSQGQILSCPLRARYRCMFWPLGFADWKPLGHWIIWCWGVWLSCTMELLTSSALTNYGEVNIVCSSFEVVMQTMKYTMIYLGSSPSSEVIALRPLVWYWRWASVTKGWVEGSRSSHGERRKWILYPLPEG